MKRFTLLSLVFLIFTAFAFSQSGEARKTVRTADQSEVTLNKAIEGEVFPVDLLRNEDQGFEGYPDFSITFDPWFVNDVDGANTYGIENYSFPGDGDPMAFMVFNPDNVTPSMSDDPAIQPHSGDKFAACFSSIPPPFNDDWLITPQLNLGSNSELSLWVKSYTDAYGLERYNIGVSTTDNNPGSFEIISGLTPLLAPADEWQEQTFDLSGYDGQSIYIGIQCVSEDAFIFMVDDVSVTWDMASLDPPTNLYGEVNQSNGQVELSWDFSGGGSGEWIPVSGFWNDLGGGEWGLSTNEHKWASVYFDMEIADYEFEVTCEESNEYQSQVGIIFSGTPQPIFDNGYWTNGYSSTVSSNTGIGMYTVGNQVGDEFTYFVDWTQDEDVNYGYGEWNTIKVIRSGAYMEIFINGVSKGSWFDSSHPTGYLGLIMAAPDMGGDAKFKDITITPITDETRDFQYFKVFRDDIEIGTTTDQTYIDDLPSFGTYEYKVSAFYDEGESAQDGPVSVTWFQGGGTATLSGRVIDATNDDPIEGATVSVAGLSDITDAFGNYTIEEVPAGALKANFSATPNTGTRPLSVSFSDLSTENTHSVNCNAEGFITYINQQVVIPEGASVELDIPMSPEIVAGEMRLVLSWGAFPEDLDAHLLTPDIGGQSYEVYYDDQGSLTEAPYAFLDNDDVDGYGPETITIGDFFTGTYKYFIFNYDEDASVTVSDAVVKIYDAAGLQYDLDVPTSGDGFYWYVCDINGATRQVTIKNQILDAPPDNMRSLTAPPKVKPETLRDTRDIVSWDWSFGDGGSSTEQEPTHVYEQDGYYNVSLTVSDGENQNTETKFEYVIVGAIGIDEELSVEAIVYPNPSAGYVKIHSEKIIHRIILTDANGNMVLDREVSEKEYILNTETLAPGLYLIRFEGETGFGTRKLLVR